MSKEHDIVTILLYKNCLLESLARAAVGSVMAWSRMDAEKREEAMEITRLALKMIVLPNKRSKKKTEEST